MALKPISPNGAPVARYQIHDTANGILQFDDTAASADDAWERFRAILGYDQDTPGVCERDAYTITAVTD